jgi:hypothetical protein
MVLKVVTLTYQTKVENSSRIHYSIGGGAVYSANLYAHVYSGIPYTDKRWTDESALFQHDVFKLTAFPRSSRKKPSRISDSLFSDVMRCFLYFVFIEECTLLIAECTPFASLGACSASLEACSASLEACSVSLEACSASLEACSASLEACSASLGARSASLGACSASLEACSASLEACSASLEAHSASLGARSETCVLQTISRKHTGLYTVYNTDYHI